MPCRYDVISQNWHQRQWKRNLRNFKFVTVAPSLINFVNGLGIVRGSTNSTITGVLFQLMQSEQVLQYYYKWHGSCTFLYTILKWTVPALTKKDASHRYHYWNFVYRRYGSKTAMITGTVPTINLNPRYGLIQITKFLRNFYQCIQNSSELFILWKKFDPVCLLISDYIIHWSSSLSQPGKTAVLILKAQLFQWKK